MLILPSAVPDAAQVLERVMMEALRLFPPLIMLLRLAKASFAVTTSKGKTHVIPKASTNGWDSAMSVWSSDNAE